MTVIALEEHFVTGSLAALAGGARVPAHAFAPDLDSRLRDLGDGRLAAMDAAGIDLQVLSHTAPAAQHLDAGEGIPLARAANDELAEAVAAHPDRFAGFATLPTADPQAAADELERAVRELGFAGAMVNSTLGTNGRFLDDPAFGPLLARAEQLDVPLYLHPSAPPAELRFLYSGFPAVTEFMLATGAWGWHAEAGLHALRLVLAGVFERHPGLRLILGHCGEMLPFMLARIDAFLTPERTGLPQPPSAYFLRNVWVTTSGLFSLPPLLCTVQVFGIDRVLFSVDYPYSANSGGRHLIDALPFSPADRERITGGNAVRVLRLAGPARGSS
jgi:predicted TIM-barrel fold metal-dependent hydrolase